MAFSAISNTVIQVGKALKQELFQKIKDNFDDHETRIASVEGGASKIIIFDEMVVSSVKLVVVEGIAYWRAPSAFTLLDAKVGVHDISALSLSGTIEIDIQKSSSLDFTSAASIFTTKPSLNFATATSYDESTNAALDSGQSSVSAGDFLRFDIDAFPTGDTLTKFQLYLVGEV
jgi:hypothetical protein